MPTCRGPDQDLRQLSQFVVLCLAGTAKLGQTSGQGSKSDYGEATPSGGKPGPCELDGRVRRTGSDRQRHRPADLPQGHRERYVRMPEGIGGELADHQPYVFHEVEESVIDQQGARHIRRAPFAIGGWSGSGVVMPRSDSPAVARLGSRV